MMVAAGTALLLLLSGLDLAWGKRAKQLTEARREGQALSEELQRTGRRGGKIARPAIFAGVISSISVAPVDGPQ